MDISSPFCLGGCTCDVQGLKEGKKRRERAFLPYPGFRSFNTRSLEEIPIACQVNSLLAKIVDSSSINAVNFSSARTTKRLPLSRCASATKIVRPLESTVETQPHDQPDALSLSAMISQYLMRAREAASSDFGAFCTTFG